MINFNDLFDDFFKNKKPGKTNIEDEIAKIISSIQNFKMGRLDENFGDEMEKDLGEPDEVSELKGKDGYTYRKFVWNTEMGQFVKILVIADDQNEVTKRPLRPTAKTLSLQEELDEALATEDFEKAILIRDQMKKQTTEIPVKRKRTPKNK